MALKGKKSGGDFILESRHLVGLFMLLVVIFGVVFTLGYLLGRSQYDTNFRASLGRAVDAAPAIAPPPKPKPKISSDDAKPRQNSSDWDFYHSAEPKTTEDHLEPPPVKSAPVKLPPAAPKPAPIRPPPASPANISPTGDGTLIPKGTIMLQVAAVTREGDALALAQALQKKKFPAFVITPSAAPGSDKFYRVQIGPFSDSKTAMTARNDLEANGFKSIVKR
jgi:cell division septation protein DedD